MIFVGFLSLELSFKKLKLAFGLFSTLICCLQLFYSELNLNFINLQSLKLDKLKK